MSEQDIQDKQWGELLSRAHGKDVQARPEFRRELLAELKAKVAANADATAAADDARDERWSRLLTSAYTPCEPSPQFKSSLLTRLKDRQRQLAADTAEKIASDPDVVADTAEDMHFHTLLTSAYSPCDARPEFKAGLLRELKARQQSQAGAAPITPVVNEEDAVRALLAASYQPVTPRKEFETRLLENLKQRQRESQSTKSFYRRRTLYLSGLSSMAAAAMVMFVVWIMPGGKLEQPGGQGHLLASGPIETALTPVERGLVASHTSAGESLVGAAMAMPVAAAAGGSYRVADAFASSALPHTVRGIGMEINDGDGWRSMDETSLARIEPGMQFRPESGTARSGLGFNDGSTFLVFPESILTVTDNGFTVRQGEMAVTVPENSDNRFRLHFPERDIAIEPGTMLTVAVEPPDNFADGGAPAPVLKVLDGGMALAMGKSGVGPLLANQVYELDKYVTPDIPGRPLCAAETRELRRLMNPVGVEMAAAGGPAFAGGLQMVSSASRPAEIAATPDGFVKKGNRWQSRDYQDQPTVRIQYLSDAYFGFASQRRDLADILALGSDIILDGGDGHFYEIYR